MPDPVHIPVLLREVVAMLEPLPGETYLDCTAGLGGHAAAIGERLGPTGHVILMDLDPGNLERAATRVKALPTPPAVTTIHGNFADAPRLLAQRGLRANLLLADLGFASPQVDDASRGLSFSREGPLDMRLDPTAPVTAAELVNTMSEGDLADLLRDYGEEPAARKIAAKIVSARRDAPIQTTSRLAEVVRSAVSPARIPGRRPIDPATKTFQALRIAVNDELGSLNSLLAAVRLAASRMKSGRETAADWLSPGARVAVISFHSLEDRPVKQAFVGMVEQGLAHDVSSGHAPPTEEEIGANPRSRSAKVRVVRLAGVGGSSTG